MKFTEANPKHNEYWWVLDEDGTRTIVWIEHGKNNSVIAQYPGNAGVYNARELEYVGKASVVLPAKQAKPFDFSDLEKQYGGVLHVEIGRDNITEEDIEAFKKLFEDAEKDPTGANIVSRVVRYLTDPDAPALKGEELDAALGVISTSNKTKGAAILDQVTHNELDREKIELADALINLLPGDYSKMQRIKMLEDAIGYTPKHILHGDHLDDMDDQAEQQKEENP